MIESYTNQQIIELKILFPISVLHWLMIFFDFLHYFIFFFFQAEDGIRDIGVTGVQTCALPISALLIGEGTPCADERDLDGVLTELEDRGLLGWDKRANRYDLHPLVRGVVWSSLSDDARRGIYTSLHAHFEAVPMIDDYHKVNSLEDLAPAIELYNTLIGLGRYDDARRLFYERFGKAMFYRLNTGRRMVELLEMLFP